MHLKHHTLYLELRSLHTTETCPHITVHKHAALLFDWWACQLKLTAIQLLQETLPFSSIEHNLLQPSQSLRKDSKCGLISNVCLFISVLENCAICVHLSGTIFFARENAMLFFLPKKVMLPYIVHVVHKCDRSLYNIVSMYTKYFSNHRFTYRIGSNLSTNSLWHSGQLGSCKRLNQWVETMQVPGHSTACQCYYPFINFAVAILKHRKFVNFSNKNTFNLWTYSQI